MLALTQSIAARIPFRLVDATDGATAVTGAVFAAADIRVTKNGGALANHAGTPAEVGAGLYYYDATAGELDTLGFVGVVVTKVAARTFVGVAQVVAGGASPSVTEIADGVLGRRVTGGASGGRTVAQALAASRNRVEIDHAAVPPVLTVYDVDDTTPLWTAVVTTGSSLPVHSIDPA